MNNNDDTKPATESLQDFKFDDEENKLDWFGINATDAKKGKTSVDKVVDKVKTTAGAGAGAAGTEAGAGGEEEDDDEGVTNLEEKGDKKKVAATKKDESDEEEDEDHFADFGDNKPKPEAGKEKAGAKEKTEGDTGKAKKAVVTPANAEGGEEAEEGSEEEGDDEENYYTNQAKKFKERGFFVNVEIPEDKKINEDEFFDLHDQDVELRVDEALEELLGDMDEDGKAFLQHKKEGGSTEEFAQIYFAGAMEIPEEFDENNEEQRNRILNYYLTIEEGMTGEDLADRLAWLKDHGKEKAYAAKYHTAVIKGREKAKAEMIRMRKEAIDNREASKKEFDTKLKAVLEKTETVGAIPITKTDQRELGAYINRPSIKVGKNRFAPPFQVELAKILKGNNEEDRKKLVVLAKLVKNGFSIEGLDTKAKTKIVKEVQAEVSKNKMGIRTKPAGSATKRELADYFNEE